jgi:hypothetical protein
LLSHLLFAGISEGLLPETVIVAGKVRLRGGTLVDVDEDEAMAKAREAAEALWNRL